MALFPLLEGADRPGGVWCRAVMGVGCGGPSRVGQSYGRSLAHSADVIRQALDAGVNVVDTAEAYGTEEADVRRLRHIFRRVDSASGQ